MKISSCLFITGLLVSNLTLAVSKSSSSQSSLSNAAEKAENSLATPNTLFIGAGPLVGLYRTTILAPQHGTDLALSLSQSQIKFTFSGDYSKSSNTLNYNMENLAIAYAISPQLFIGASVGMGQSNGSSEYTYSPVGETTTSHSKSNGLMDPLLSIGGRIDASQISTILNLGTSIKTGDSEYTSTNSGTNREANLKNGASAIIPSVAVFTNSKSSTLLGFSASYTFMQEHSSIDRYNGKTSTGKGTGGNIQNISVFAESPESSFVYGGALTYVKLEPSETKYETSTSTSFGLSYVTVTGFLKFSLNNNFSLIPSITLGRFGEGLGKESDTKDIYSAGLTGKATF
ncbi:MAG: hypothetical protein HUU56_08035 [Bdellovibrionaceae bacterium]|nr:hypothetical protein [Pseudobdellovibrionaceae bacterium]